MQLASKIAFLRRPSAYPDRPARVTLVETHMSCVFLTDAYAYKLKKPIQQEQLNFTTLERRQYYCSEEVRLNRRLAEAVYLGTVALTMEPDGSLALGGEGEIVEWLVHMRRLPSARMLDAVIACRPVGQTDVDDVARRLGVFYARAPALALPGAVLRARLARGLEADRQELCRPELGLDRARVERVVERQRAFLTSKADVIDARAEAGRVVEGHGDLRPEHICLEPPPAIIDCLEFCEELRQVDPIDELAFLGLECERLGQPQVGDWFLAAYTGATGDTPPPGLLEFYRNYRALRRARLAAWRVRGSSAGDAARFTAKARCYVELTSA